MKYIDYEDIMLTTTDHIPHRKYEILGLVMGNRLLWWTTKGASRTALERLKEAAIDMGADAVIGIKPDKSFTRSQCYIGTAIKFID